MKAPPIPASTITAISRAKLPSRHQSDQALRRFHGRKDVSLEVRYGESTGLLGANGAGKTTTIKMLCGLLDRPGDMLLTGERGSLRSPEVRQRIGYMSQKFSLL